MLGQPGLFDVDQRLKRLSDLGDQLRGVLKAAKPKVGGKERPSATGRRAFHPH